MQGINTDLDFLSQQRIHTQEKFVWMTCKRRLYSGCGGNQNNFQTRRECFANCVSPPNNTFNKHNQYTTCIPYIIPGVS
ncbi:hypothetical protein MSG28_000930 [Choristoneura fumiferana]|uniref:Uncharacterized protein n=1 Tax=Choristoneura fumiferana TaxID=7141 RepID=A0ACC0K335_CHOFU|nr:hypothetical protein MSG28_000930 [Choristoneura fumiferana]